MFYIKKIMMQRKNIFLIFCAMCVISTAFAFYVAPSAHAQVVSTASAPWKVSAYMWNERLNMWARTSCDMSVGGVGASGSCVPGCAALVSSGACPTSQPASCTSSHCDGSTGAKSALRYYHDGQDANGNGVFDAGEIKPGEMRGKAWSLVIGTISFDLTDFPVDDPATTTVNESSCYGLTGSARQARVVRVNLGSNNRIDRTDTIFNPATDDISKTRVALVGCAYVPLLKDFILLSPVGATFPSPSPSSNWVGVFLEVMTGAARHNLPGTSGEYQYVSGIGSNKPRIEIFGCGWSQKNESWAFGVNKNTVTGANDNDCLPSQQNTKLRDRIDTAGISTEGQQNVEIQTNPPVARVGQRVTYTLKCPPGYSNALSIQLYEGVDVVDLVSRDNQNRLSDSEWNNPANEKRHDAAPNSVGYSSGQLLHRFTEILFSPLTAVRLVCVDKHTHKIFSGKGVGESGVVSQKTKSVRGVNIESVVVHNFSASPQVITEGGVVDIDARISNFGDASKNNAFCKVTNTITNKKVLCFKTESLTLTNTLADLPNRSPATYSVDTVVQDTSYELSCHYKKGPYQSTDRSYSESELCGGSVSLTGWNRIGPLRTAVKVSPNRLFNRIVSSSVPAPSISVSGSNIVIGLPNASYLNESDVRVYEFGTNEFSGGGNREVNQERPKNIYSFFSNKAAADRVTRNRCQSKSGSDHPTCIAGDLYGTYISSGATVKVLTNNSTSVNIPKSSVSGKTLVAEMFTKDGRRSPKTIYVVGN